MYLFALAERFANGLVHSAGSWEQPLVVVKEKGHYRKIQQFEEDKKHRAHLHKGMARSQDHSEANLISFTGPRIRRSPSEME